MKKMKLAGIMTALLAAMLLLASCGSSSGGARVDSIPEGKSISQTKDVTAAVQVDFTTMDPLDTSDNLSGGVQRLMMDGLFGFDDNMKIIPMLATGYQANANATEFVITLRKGVSFTDGTPWNADAAIANFHRWMDKSLGLKRTTFVSGIIQNVAKVDDYTIKVTLNKPFGAFINNLAHPALLVVSPKQISQGSEVIARNPVGTGQYKYVEWVPGDHLTLALNKDWWGYKPELNDGKALAAADAGFKSVTFKPVPEDASRVAMLQAGDAQVIWPVPTESLQVLESDNTLSAHKEEGIVVRYLFMNTQKPALKDLRVRQAIAYAIDKDAYIKVVRNGMGSVAASVIAPKVQFFKANEPVKYDPAKAKELLQQAGYGNGLNLKLMYTNTTINQKQGEFYKQQLAQVGINVQLESVESAIMNQRVQGAKGPGADQLVELYMATWSPSTGDADWGIRPLLGSESVPPMSYNISYYQNPQMDEYLATGLGSADDNVRREAYAKAQDLYWHDIPMISMANDFNTWATSGRILGVKMYPDNAINMRNARMAE